MLYTEEIDDATASRWFEWLNGQESNFRCGAIEAFREEMTPPYKQRPESTYYVVYEEERALLLIKTSPLENGSLGISFARIFERISSQRCGFEAHLWIKNALEEKIVPLCLNKNIDLITAKATTFKGKRVFECLEELWSNEGINNIIRITRMPDPWGTFVYISLSNSIIIIER